MLGFMSLLSNLVQQFAPLFFSPLLPLRDFVYNYTTMLVITPPISIPSTSTPSSSSASEAKVQAALDIAKEMILNKIKKST